MQALKNATPLSWHRWLAAACGLALWLAWPTHAHGQDTAPGLPGNWEEQLNLLWLLLASAMVFLMQAGFMCVESGLSRAKNSINVAIKNMSDFLLSTFVFWALGFGLMFGLSHNGWLGTTGFAGSLLNSPWLLGVFLFQAMFCGTATTIVSGIIAERGRFSVYCCMSVLISVLIYPVFGHWAWGGLVHTDNPGWLQNLGFIDFAGSTVVHGIGAWVGLAAAIVIGPRLKRFDADGKPHKFQPSNLVQFYLGVFILFFGWFGFNAGSTMAITTDIALIAVNTCIAACVGGMTAAGFNWIRTRGSAPEAIVVGNGVLGGLVAITAGCAVLSPAASVFVGAIGGLCVVLGEPLLERFKIDDVAGAIPVHGFAGAAGTILLAALMPADLLNGVGRLHQIGIQAMGVGVAFVWAFGMSMVLFATVNRFTKLRVSEEDETIGLNVSEHGAKSTLLDLAQAMTFAAKAERFDNTVKVEPEWGTEVGDLCHCYNQLIDALQEQQADLFLTQHDRDQHMASFRAHMKKTVDTVQQQAEACLAKLAETNEQTEHVCRIVDQVTTSIEQMTDTLNEVCQSAVAASQTAEAAKNESTQSHQTVDQLRTNTKAIEDIITTMRAIADETNLLALNASIEAARSGEAGRGFAVVADAVRGLAQQSDQSTQAIRQQIQDVQNASGNTLTAMGSITEYVDQLNASNATVAEHMRTQTVTTQGIQNTVKEANGYTQIMRQHLGEVGEQVTHIRESITKSLSEFEKMFAAT